jgi:hypothetical protein
MNERTTHENGCLRTNERHTAREVVQDNERTNEQSCNLKNATYKHQQTTCVTQVTVKYKHAQSNTKNEFVMSFHNSFFLLFVAAANAAYDGWLYGGWWEVGWWVGWLVVWVGGWWVGWLVGGWCFFVY